MHIIRTPDPVRAAIKGQVILFRRVHKYKAGRISGMKHHIIGHDGAEVSNGFITDYDLYLFNEGSHHRIYEKLGAHPVTVDGRAGTHFAVWAPNAKGVSLVCNYNHWDGRAHPMTPVGSSGVWTVFIPDIHPGEVYKYEIRTQSDEILLKADPFAFTVNSARVRHR